MTLYLVVLFQTHTLGNANFARSFKIIILLLRIK